MKKEKVNYQTPSTEIVGVEMESHVLSGSQGWPSNAPVNALREGYGEGFPEEW